MTEYEVMPVKVSVHFTPRNQSINSFTDRLNSTIKLLSNFGAYIDIYHCFPSMQQCKDKGLTLEIPTMFEKLKSGHVCIYENTQDEYDVKKARSEMYKPLDSDSIALFFGEIKDGVLDEYVMLKNKGVKCAHINL